MEDRQFDSLATTMSGARSRRTVLNILGAGTLAAVFGRFATEVAADGKRKRKNRNRKKKTCKVGTTKCGKKACCKPDQICVGGTCVTGQGTCPAGADRCVDGGPSSCNGTDLCACFRSANGDTRCGTVLGSACGDCAVDTDCADFGPGAFCAATIGDNCCTIEPKGFCAIPCPS